jgi:eukaryotic-like serine/threonine-protein kinase
MKVCSECGRSFSDEAVLCAFDGTSLGQGDGSRLITSSSMPAAGDQLGSYTIQERIAEGGMGVVYSAVHVRLGRRVAIKVLKPELLKQRPDAISRFLQEARAVNGIGHPHIIDIIDFVEISDREPPLVYMVMELLDGEDLSARIKGIGALSADEVLKIAVQVTDALEAVHARGMLHRDLKPENIFLLEGKDEDRRVKLLDFGISKKMDPRSSEHLTEPGTTIGTPEYMAPEQILCRPLDVRTDIYALGIVLYHMLAGSLPFASSNCSEVFVKQLQETPEPLPARQQTPPDLEQLVMQCLEKDPEQRIQSAAELRRELHRVLDGGRAAETEPMPAVEPARKERPTVHWAMMILGGSAVLVGGILAWTLMKPAAEATAAVSVSSVKKIAAKKIAVKKIAAKKIAVKKVVVKKVAPDPAPAATRHSPIKRSPPRRRTPRARPRAPHKKRDLQSRMAGTVDPFAQ